MGTRVSQITVNSTVWSAACLRLTIMEASKVRITDHLAGNLLAKGPWRGNRFCGITSSCLFFSGRWWLTWSVLYLVLLFVHLWDAWLHLHSTSIWQAAVDIRIITIIVRMPYLVWWVGCHDDVIKWKHFPHYLPFVQGIHRSRIIPRTKASDAELWSFLWSAPE